MDITDGVGGVVISYADVVYHVNTVYFMVLGFALSNKFGINNSLIAR